MTDKLSVMEAAKRLGYHPNHVRRLINKGTMKGEKFGNYWLVSVNEVNRIKSLQDENGRLTKVPE